MGKEDKIESSGSFCCMLPNLLENQNYIITLEEEPTIKPEVFVLMGVNCALICEKELDLDTDNFEFLLERSKISLQQGIQVIEEDMIGLRNITAPTNDSRMGNTGCWVTTVTPASNITFVRPECVNSQETISINAVKLLDLTKQVTLFQQTTRKIYEQIQKTPDVRVDFFFSGDLFSYFLQLRFNYLGALIISNLIATTYTTITIIFFCRNKCLCRPSNRRACSEALYPVFSWFCREENQGGAPVRPPRRRDYSEPMLEFRRNRMLEDEQLSDNGNSGENQLALEYTPN